MIVWAVFHLGEWPDLIVSTVIAFAVIYAAWALIGRWRR